MIQKIGGMSMISIQVGGILGFIILVLDIWAIVNIIRSNQSVGTTVLWIVLIIILPVVGLILWFLLGPKAKA
jgi:hypothetical protein